MSVKENGRFICCSPIDLGAGDAYLIDLQGGGSPPPGFTPTAWTYLPTVMKNAQGTVPTATPMPGGASFTQQPIDTAVQHGQHANVVDIDNDGDNDVILALSLDDAINLYINNGSGQFAMNQIAPNDTIVAMKTAVLQEPSARILALAGTPLPTQPIRMGWWLPIWMAMLRWNWLPPANPASTWTANVIVANFGTGNNARPAAADFDGDGDMDVAVSSNDAGFKLTGQNQKTQVRVILLLKHFAHLRGQLVR